MKKTIPLNLTELITFQKNRGSLLIQDVNEFALKAMALVILYPEQVTHQPKQAIHEAEESYPQIFSRSRNMLSKTPNQEALLSFIRYLSDAQAKGLFTQQNKFDWVQYLLYDDSLSTAGIVFHQSVYQLFNSLLTKTNAQNVYIPFETRFYHSVMLGQQCHVYAEGMEDSSIPALIKVILEKMDYQMNDVIQSPSYIKNGTLQKFDAGFVAEPWGMKSYDKEFFNHARFAIESNNYQNYLIQHTMQQVNGLLMAIVPTNMLVSAVTSEEKMRKWFLEQKSLKAVISLPNGLLMNTNMNSNILVFDLKQQFEHVYFISLKDSKFIKRQSRDIELTNIEDLANLILSNDISDNKTTVNYQKIAQQNYVLEPERYAVNEDSKKALSILNNYSTQKLEEIVEILRPVPIAKLKEEGYERVYEVQGGDLPEYGYIDVASKAINISHTILEDYSSVLLQANDIIMTVRGSVGKVGIVSQELLDRYQGKVMIGQTNFILRVKNNNLISSQALLMQLRSDFGQTRLRLLSAGAVIAGVSIKDLKNFPIAIFSQEQQKKLEESLKNQQIIKQEIEAKKAYMNQLANDIWA